MKGAPEIHSAGVELERLVRKLNGQLKGTEAGNSADYYDNHQNPAGIYDGIAACLEELSKRECPASGSIKCALNVLRKGASKTGEETEVCYEAASAFEALVYLVGAIDELTPS